MQTRFSTSQLADPACREANRILRNCVHCGFCNSTCPTYLLLGDELDGPRGRIYLMKEMLENESHPSEDVVKHIDRCLSCLACMTTCPSGVHYMHLVDHSRNYIERHYRRPLGERLIRRMLASTVPFPNRFRWMLNLSRMLRPLVARLPGRLGHIARQTPQGTKSGDIDGGLRESHVARAGTRRGAVGLLAGCVQQVLGHEINAATIRVLNRLGFDVQIFVEGPCCGAVEHHLGMEKRTQSRLRKNVVAWQRLIQTHELEAIIVNTSGCGTMLKEYGHLLRNDPHLADAAVEISGITRDISEFLHERRLNLTAVDRTLRTVAYQSACSLQHGQGIDAQPVKLLQSLGFEVVRPAEGHICCGSAGTYNLLQPELAEKLGRRKADAIEATGADVIASGNIGCITQLRQYTGCAIVHTIELIDWACGGPVPSSIANVATIQGRRDSQ